MTQKFEIANVLWDTGLDFDKSVVSVLKFDSDDKFSEFVFRL